MPTKKLYKVDSDKREIWNEEEARAQLRMVGRKYDEYWDKIKNDSELILFAGGYYKYNLLQVMFKYPIVGDKRISKSLVQIMK